MYRIKKQTLSDKTERFYIEQKFLWWWIKHKYLISTPSGKPIHSIAYFDSLEKAQAEITILDKHIIKEEVVE